MNMNEKLELIDKLYFDESVSNLDVIKRLVYELADSDMMVSTYFDHLEHETPWHCEHRSYPEFARETYKFIKDGIENGSTFEIYI